MPWNEVVCIPYIAALEISLLIFLFHLFPLFLLNFFLSLLFFHFLHSPSPLVAIMKEVEECGNLTELLRVDSDLESGCLERALFAAVKIEKLIEELFMEGASSIQDALQQAVKEKKYHTLAMLLLVIAVVDGNKQLVLKLFAEFSGTVSLPGGIMISDDDIREVQKIIAAEQVSTLMPIIIADRRGQSSIREELLLRTGVKPEEGIVYWHGLRLLSIELSWIRHIYWVKKLHLAHNGLHFIPREIGQHLKHVS